LIAHEVLEISSKKGESEVSSKRKLTKNRKTRGKLDLLTVKIAIYPSKAEIFTF
jgi:hypothetical protein